MKKTIEVIKAIKAALGCSLTMAKRIYDTRPSDDVFEILEHGKSVLPKNCVYWSADEKKFLLAPKTEKAEGRVAFELVNGEYRYLTENETVVKFFEENRELDCIIKLSA